MQSNKELIKYLVETNHLKSPRIIKAFKAVDRVNFVTQDLKHLAYVDTPQTIGYGQTISQPSTVAFMLEQLQPGFGDKILDIGFGSGWTSAIFSEIEGSSGRVYALEYNKEIFDFGRKNLGIYGYKNLELINSSGWKGFVKAAPFNRILVSAASKRVSTALIDQLVFGGRLVIPVKNSIMRIDKDGQGKVTQKEFPGFVFVPFIETE